LFVLFVGDFLCSEQQKDQQKDFLLAEGFSADLSATPSAARAARPFGVFAAPLEPSA
jgi:hypothetical protein